MRNLWYAVSGQDAPQSGSPGLVPSHFIVYIYFKLCIYKITSQFYEIFPSKFGLGILIYTEHKYTPCLLFTRKRIVPLNN